MGHACEVYLMGCKFLVLVEIYMLLFGPYSFTNFARDYKIFVKTSTNPNKDFRKKMYLYNLNCLIPCKI